jgi:hypothetical protein
MSLSDFFANKTSKTAGDILVRIKPLVKFLFRNLRKTNSLFFNILYRGLTGRSFPGSSSILWSYVL